MNEEYPYNEEIWNELYFVKKGLDGENEISYQLKKAHVGMYVLRDIKVKYEGLTAQIDYVIITPIYIYYVECKNLVGNITVTEKGDFIREWVAHGKRVQKGIYSPLRQVEAQREVLRKIWESQTSKFRQFFASKNFEFYRRVLVVVTNYDTILNTSKAPQEMKNKILRADSLVHQIEDDIAHINEGEYLYSQSEMERIAEYYIDISVQENIDYYEFYKKKYCSASVNHDDLKERLIKFRKNRANELHIPAYYVFTNEELDKLIKLRPKTMEDLKNSQILMPVKIKTHGELILAEMNRENKNE